MPFTITVDGVQRQVVADGGRSLLEVLREDLGITGPKLGCGEGACGACTVLIGRRAVTACSTPAAEVAGQRITTVEGLAEDGLLHPVQQAWLETGAMQCGYCTPGWLMATAALLNRAPHPDDARIAAELSGNVCRCCTYPRVRRAGRRAAELMQEPELLEPVPAADAGSGSADELRAAAGPPPWDQARDAAPFFEQLPDGLVTVVADDGPAAGPGQGRWGGPDDAWVHVGADGSVTAFTGKVEAGQGTRTALGLLVAEELAVPSATVRVVMGNTDTSPFDMGTFGSRSMPFAAPPLRAAAAAAREALREAAADRFGIPASRLTVADGIVAGPDGAPSIGYSDLLAGVRRVEKVPPGRPVTPPPAWRSAGHPARAAGGASVVTGAKRVPADLRADGTRHRCGRGAARGERGPGWRVHRRGGSDQRGRASRRRCDRSGVGPLPAARHRRARRLPAVAPDRRRGLQRRVPARGGRRRRGARGRPGAPGGALHGRLHRPCTAGGEIRDRRLAGRAPHRLDRHLHAVPRPARAGAGSWYRGRTGAPHRARLRRGLRRQSRQHRCRRGGAAVAGGGMPGEGPVEPPRGVPLGLPAPGRAHRRRRQRRRVRRADRVDAPERQLRGGRDRQPVPGAASAPRVPARRLAAAAGTLPRPGRDGEQLRQGIAHGRACARDRRGPAAVPAAAPARWQARRRVPGGGRAARPPAAPAP